MIRQYEVFHIGAQAPIVVYAGSREAARKLALLKYLDETPESSDNSFVVTKVQLASSYNVNRF